MPEPCGLLWSGGLDSTLLLLAALRAQRSFTICQFRAFMTPEQLKRTDALIAETGITVYSYPFANRYLVGEGENIAVIFEYAVGDTVIPNIRDAIGGDICVADIADASMTDSPLSTVRDWIVGTRGDDRHYAVPGAMIPSQEWTSGGTRFYAPLHDWTRDEVVGALAGLGHGTDGVSEAEDTGNIAMCTVCLNGTGKVFCPKEKAEIDAVVWNRELNTQLFRDKFGLK